MIKVAKFPHTGVKNSIVRRFIKFSSVYKKKKKENIYLRSVKKKKTECYLLRKKKSAAERYARVKNISLENSVV